MIQITFTWPINSRQAVKQTLISIKSGISDLRPIFHRFVRQILRSEKQTFMTVTSPFGEPWAPLTDEYAAQKGRSGGTRRKTIEKRTATTKAITALASVFRPILQRSGDLFRAATRKGAKGQFVEVRARGMTFSVKGLGIYPTVHQQTDRVRKDGVPIRRAWLGLRLPGDLTYLQIIIRAYLRKVMKKGTGVDFGE